MIEQGFWRGFAPFLASFCASIVAAQIDMTMVAKMGAGALAAYAMVTRLALVDFVLTGAVGTVSAVSIARAYKDGAHAEALRTILICSILLRAATATLGAFAYPVLIDLLAGGAATASFGRAAIFFHVMATPFRLVASATSFAMHALGNGALVLESKIFEMFAGCFIANLLTAAVCAFWSLSWAARIGGQRGLLNNFSPAVVFLRDYAIEATRGLAPQLAVTTSLALFAALWPSPDRMQRLDAYAAVQSLMLLFIAPLTTSVRFFALRFSSREKREVKRLMLALWRQGAPIFFFAGVALLLGGDRLGALLYGNLGV